MLHVEFLPPQFIHLHILRSFSNTEWRVLKVHQTFTCDSVNSISPGYHLSGCVSVKYHNRPIKQTVFVLLFCCCFVCFWLLVDISRIAQRTVALTKLKPAWNAGSISLSSTIRLICSPVTSISCILVNHGPSQQNCKEEYKPWKWGATARYSASYAKTMLPIGKSMPRTSKQSDHTKTSWPS